MTDLLISDLTAVTSIGDTDLFEVQQGSSPTLKGTAAQLRTYSQNNLFIDRAPFIAGRWYNLSASVPSAGAAVPINTIRLYPFLLSRPMTVQAVGLRVTTLGAAGNVQMAVYATSAVTGLPTGNPLITTVSQSTAATGSFSRPPVSGNTLLPAGIYWAATNSNVATTVYQCFSAGGGATLSYIAGGTSLASITASATTTMNSLSFAQTFGTWPDLTAQTFTESSALTFAMLFFQAA